MEDQRIQLARELRDLLAERRLRVVLAESCTGGRTAGALTVLPGISEWLCGSFVVYRCESKSKWLGIPAEMLVDPNVGPVSAEVSSLLAEAALRATPEAGFAVAVTGDVGPGADSRTDGVLFCAACKRGERPQVERIQLESPAPADQEDLAARHRRLEEAVLRVLRFAVAQASHRSR